MRKFNFNQLLKTNMLYLIYLYAFSQHTNTCIYNTNATQHIIHICKILILFGLIYPLKFKRSGLDT